MMSVQFHALDFKRRELEILIKTKLCIEYKEILNIIKAIKKNQDRMIMK